MKLFTALEIPEAIRIRLDMMMVGIPGAHWVDPDGLHLTLRYIGEADPHTAQDIDDALARIRMRPFTLRLASLGTFADPARVLWAGVEPSQPLAQLVEKVDGALTRLRVDFDRRRHTPHVTLARFRGHPGPDLGHFINAHASLRSEPFEVTRFVLYSSHRSHAGSVYEPERYYLF